MEAETRGFGSFWLRVDVSWSHDGHTEVSDFGFKTIQLLGYPLLTHHQLICQVWQGGRALFTERWSDLLTVRKALNLVQHRSEIGGS